MRIGTKKPIWALGKSKMVYRARTALGEMMVRQKATYEPQGTLQETAI
jgi:hypothetical protein